MGFENPDDKTMLELMKHSKTIAVVGLSNNINRASNRVASYMQKKGYRIIPVNPNESEVLGQKSYPDLKSVPEQIDLVNVFRRSEYVSQVAEEARELGAKGLWLQLGVKDDQASAKARDAGMTVVQNKCLMIEHGRVVK